MEQVIEGFELLGHPLVWNDGIGGWTCPECERSFTDLDHVRDRGSCDETDLEQRTAESDFAELVAQGVQDIETAHCNECEEDVEVSLDEMVITCDTCDSPIGVDA